ncbi:MAG: DNA primase [Bacteroidetes bacterium ADurb.Bin408]|nr:MAG: DNA primase [Bacteroidetes bacterium ADurb.Bin408]
MVGDFVKLKKSGANLKGLCPFHNEKTPSFMVNPAKNIFKCFGCGESGNPVTFVMKHEHYSYPEALRYLAEKYSITIEEDTDGPDFQPDFEEKESLYALNSFAQKYFTNVLLSSEEGKAVARTYLDSRGIKAKDIDKFSLGYNPDSWDAFTNYALENGYKLSLLETAGLTVVKDTKTSYDKFKGRIIFPIHNLTGRIAGFGARVIGKAEGRPKYMNSPETEIYNKSKILYGLYQAKSQVSSKDNCYLVEGYTDVIAMHKAGIENVVASSGTSLTIEQIRLIKRYTENITILYDGDAAGIHASLRGMNMILEEGMNVKIVLFPEGEDPDSFSKSREALEVRNYINDNAQDFVKFKTSLLLKDTENDPIKKASLIRDIVETIAVIPDSILRSLYIKECSTLLGITEQNLQNHLNKELRSRLKKKLPATDEDIPEATAYTAEKQIIVDLDDATDDENNLIRFLLNYAGKEIYLAQVDSVSSHAVPKKITIAAYLINDILNSRLKFDDTLLQFIFDEFAKALHDESFPDESYFLNMPDPALRKKIIDIIATPYQLSENWEKKYTIFIDTEEKRLSYFADWYLDNFKSRKILKLIRENTQRIKTAKEEEIPKLLSYQQKLNQIKNELAKKMSRVFIK